MAREEIPRLDWQETCLSTRLLDAKTRWPDLLEHFVCRCQDFQTPRPLPAYVIMMQVRSGKANLAQRSVAMALLSGSASGAARAKASSVCKLSSNEQE